MDCATFQAQLPSVMVHRNNDGARTAFAEHATACLTCRKILQEWEEAQRALETALGTAKTDPRHLKSLSESLYVEQFGSALELNPQAKLMPIMPNLPMPLLIGAAGGLLAGYLAWGSSSSNNLFEQLLQMELLGSGRLGGGPAAMAGLPGMLGSGTSVVRDLFGICLIIWVTRSRLWDLIFPVVLPRGIHMAKWLAIPLVIVGALRVIGSVFMGPSAMMLAMRNSGFLGEVSALMGVGWVLIDAGWRYGFWLLLFLILFTLVENLSLQYLRGKPPEPGK